MLCGRFDVENALVDAAAVVLCTCPDEETAARIARKLVDDGLAACVNRLAGVVSTYRWQGRIEEDTLAEVQSVLPVDPLVIGDPCDFAPANEIGISPGQHNLAAIHAPS